MYKPLIEFNPDWKSLLEFSVILVISIGWALVFNQDQLSPWLAIGWLLASRKRNYL